MGAKLALSAGHGRNTAGKRCLKALDPAQTREWTLNDRIARKVAKLLEGYEEVEVCRVDDPTGKTDVALSDRVKAARDFGAQVYLSLHHNAGVLGGKGGGIVAYVHPDAGAQARLWQRQLYDALVAATGLKGNRATPLAKKNLKELRLAAMPAALLELGFMDSQTDVPIILSEAYADQCAGAIAKVIAARMALTKKPPEPEQKPPDPEQKPPAPEQKAPLCKGGCHRCAVTGGLSSATSPTTEPSAEGKLYRVQVGAFSSLENAQKLKQRLHAAGFPEAYIRR